MDKSSKKVLREAFESLLPRERQTSAGREVYFTKDEYESAFEGFAAGYAAGAADMKERGAEFFEETQRNGNSWVTSVAASAAMRALPITPTNPVEGEQG